MKVNDKRFDVAIYTPSILAAHLGIPLSTLRNWIGKDGLITRANQETAHGPSLPFIAFAEALIYSQFRKQGLSMQAIHAGMKVVRRELGDQMLEKDRLASDGKDILMSLPSTSENVDWIRAKDLQHGIPGIIEDCLKFIEWASDDYPQTINLPMYEEASVIADYRFAFGQPIIRNTRTRVEDIVDLFKAGESLDSIVEEMLLGKNIVESIIRVHVVKLAA